MTIKQAIRVLVVDDSDLVRDMIRDILESDGGIVVAGEASNGVEAIARAYRNGAIGLIMSGMGDDGVAGMQAILAAGGATIAQDAKSSVVYGMNRLAVERGYVQKVVALAAIPDELMLRSGA